MKNTKNKYNSPVAKRLKRLNESLEGTTEKLFRELVPGEEFSMTPDGKIMTFNGEITGSPSVVSPTRMCYYMAGYKDETRVDGTKEELLDTVVFSYGVPDSHEDVDADEAHDQELIDDAYSTTYRDTIIDCANRCRKASNRKLILSLLDDPDVILEENFKPAKNTRKGKKHSRRVNESYDMQDGYPVLDNDQLKEIYGWVYSDKWIEAMILHYIDVRKSTKDDDHNEMSVLVIKHVARKFGFDVKKMKCEFGYYRFVLDVDIVYKGTPAYLHISKEIEDDKWNIRVFKRGH